MKTCIERITRIAKAAKLDDKLTAANTIREDMKSAPFRVCVCGEAGSGKSTFLRNVLDAKIPFPISAIPKGVALEVSYAEQDSCFCGEQKVEPAVLNGGYDLVQDPSFHINSELLEKTGAIIFEPSSARSPLYAESCESVQEAIGSVDCCIYIMDARHACSRGDMRVLSLLKECGIPTFVTASHFDFIDDEEKGELLSYLKKMVPTSPLVTTAWDELLTDGAVAAAREFVLEARANLLSHRDQVVLAAYQRVLTHAIEALEKQRDFIDSKQEKVEEIARKKKRELAAQIDLWRASEDFLDERKRSLKANMTTITTKGAERCTDRLMQAFKGCQRDATKLIPFCEDTIPWEIKNYLSDTKSRLVSDMNRHLQQTDMQLEKSLLNITKKPGPGREYSTMEMNVEVEVDNPHLLTANVEQIKSTMKKRIGQAGAIAMVGGLLTSTPIVGLTGAAVMIPRLLDNIIDWRKKGDKEKDMQRVQEHIRNEVEKCRLALEQEASKKIDECFEKLRADIRERKKEWESHAETERQNETKLARFNIQKQKENIEQILLEAKSLSATTPER